jgi:hypothetical protein
MSKPDSPGRVPPDWGEPLSEADYKNLEASWITRELADAAMLRRVDAYAGAEIIGQKGRDCAGVLFPYYPPGEQHPVNYRVRRDHPEWVAGKDGKLKPSAKYLGAKNSRNRLYFPPGVTSEQIQDVAIPIVFAEGEKKALALQRLAWHEAEAPRFIPVASGGIWNWRGKVGISAGPNGERLPDTGPIPDLDRVLWRRRTVRILYDTNVHINDDVRSARMALARTLAERGAAVEFITLPEDCGVNGVDDLLAAWGPDRVLELFKKTESPWKKDGKPTQAQMVVELADEVNLFHTPDGEGHAQILVDDHKETWMLRSKGFRRWLAMKFYEAHRKPLGTQAVHDAINLLDAKAQFDAPELPVYVRVAEYGGYIYIDLCDTRWQAIEIGPRGWRITAEPPVRFRRTRAMQALPVPVMGGSISLLRNFINVGDDHNWVLCASWLAAACRPKGPYPILILHGEQGSAKSTMEKLLRRTIDPSSSLVRTPPRQDQDLLIAAANSWVIAYDNLSGIPPWLSDSLCRLATGGGYSTRELYTDSDEVFFDAMRPVMLNGIDHLAERADLADRAVILNLPRIEDKDRQDEARLYADFERDLPQILGALFNAVSSALARLPHTQIDSKPRMADFALWASAAEEALGFQAGAFINAYRGNRAEAVQETLESDPVGAAILAHMSELAAQNKAERWEGTCKELKEDLEKFIDERVKKERTWPNNPRGMSSRLRRLATFLRESGITVTFQPKGAKGLRLVTLARTTPDLTAATATTAPVDPSPPHLQQLESQPPDGGRAAGVADRLPPDQQPPPDSLAAMSLNGRGNQQGEAEVAEVAVVCSTVLEHQTAHADRFDLCARCGRVDWEWVRGVWVCPNCGDPARGQESQAQRADIERFEI